MTELVYVLVLEAKFCEFESRLGHQIFYAPLVKWILHNATNVEVGVWFSQGAPVLEWDFSWYGYSGGLKNRWSWFDSNRSYQICSHSIMALHTLGKGETQVQFLLGAPSFLPRWRNRYTCQSQTLDFRGSNPLWGTTEDAVGWFLRPPGKRKTGWCWSGFNSSFFLHVVFWQQCKKSLAKLHLTWYNLYMEII